MKKIIFSLILTLLLATSVHADQEPAWKGKWDGKSSVVYDLITIKPEIKMNVSLDPATKVVYVIINRIRLFDASNGQGKVLIDLETVDSKGNNIVRTLEKKVEGGHGYYYEIVTEEMEAQGKIVK